MSSAASSATSSALAALYNHASPSKLAGPTQSGQSLDMQFLNMLMTELQNEDPTNPVDSTTMLAQQAQFESLTQMQDLNTNLSALIAMQSVSQATALIGTTVVGTNASGGSVTGQVAGIQFQNGTPVLQVAPQGSTTTVPVQLSTVTSVY